MKKLCIVNRRKNLHINTRYDKKNRGNVLYVGIKTAVHYFIFHTHDTQIAHMNKKKKIVNDLCIIILRKFILKD